MSYHIRFASPSEMENWDDAVAANPDGGSMYQTLSFAEAKKVGGWNPLFIVFEGTEESVSVRALAIERNIPTMGKLWYFPTGPGFLTAEQLSSAILPLKEFARSNRVFLVKIESEISASAEADLLLNQAGLVKCDNVQPISSTVIVDITKPADDVLSAMPQKGRYAIKRAIRDGVTASHVDVTDENMSTMYELLSVTGSDAGFAVRTRQYYRTFWKAFSEKHQGKLYFAYFEGAVVAGAFTGSLGRKAWYKDGASIRNRKAYGASHLLQWRIIEDYCAEKLFDTYDMMGCPPSWELKNEAHPLHGLGLFKTSLSETVVDRVGTYDLVVDTSAARRWNSWGFRLASKLNRILRKEVYF